MPHPLIHKYPIPISQLCLVNTDVPAGVGAPPLDTTSIGITYTANDILDNLYSKVVVRSSLFLVQQILALFPSTWKLD